MLPYREQPSTSEAIKVESGILPEDKVIDLEAIKRTFSGNSQ